LFQLGELVEPFHAIGVDHRAVKVRGTMCELQLEREEWSGGHSRGRYFGWVCTVDHLFQGDFEPFTGARILRRSEDGRQIKVKPRTKARIRLTGISVGRRVTSGNELAKLEVKGILNDTNLDKR